MKTDSFFKQAGMQPLAARMRPRTLDEVAGQQHLLGRGKPLRQAIEQGQLHSMVFWGPPGVGKTTLARMLSDYAEARFEAISAVLAGVKEIRAAVARAEKERDLQGRRTVLFVDEVHRFNKAQQDAFLPYVEDGTVVLVGATTENPSFELNNALLSRCRIYLLRSLDADAVRAVVEAALEDKDRGFAGKLRVAPDALQMLLAAADGDARRALNLLEIAADLSSDDGLLKKEGLEQVLTTDGRRFDKGGEYFYDQISALHKAVRGSSPDAALYWLARMLDGGCDPLYLARRLVRMASEDIGNADPRALQLAINAWQVQERLGSPEGELALAQAAVYLACAAKSNATYKAFNQARADVGRQPSYDVPLHLRNAPTQLMKQLDYGREYRYAHDEPDAYAAGENYFPEPLRDTRYYQPVPRGLELQISEKLARLRSIDGNARWRRYGEVR